MTSVWKSIAAVALIASAPLASATPLKIGDVGRVADLSGGTFGPAPATGGGYQNTTIYVNGSGSSVSAGMFVLDFDNLSTPANDWLQFLSFCIDPDRFLLNFVNPYTVNSLPGAGLSAQVANDLGELWYLARNQITNSLTAAAFQLAVWELAFGATDYNLASGAFRSSAGSARTTAQGWLNTVRDGSGQVATNLGLLVDARDSRQRLLTQVQVPEPATLALYGLGILAVGLGARRRRQGSGL